MTRLTCRAILVRLPANETTWHELPTKAETANRVIAWVNVWEEGEGE